MGLLLEDMDYDEVKIRAQEYGEYIKNIFDSIMMHREAQNMKKFDVIFEWNEFMNCFNACSDCTNLEKDEYKISFNLFTPAMLEEIFKSKNIDKEYYIQIINTISQFVLSHEMYHIIFGHCTMSRSDEEKLPLDIKRKFENMCDLASINSMFPELDLYAEMGMGCNYIDSYASLYASLFIYFQILENDELNKMKKILEENEKLPTGERKKYKSVISEERDHPFITIRFSNIGDIINSHFLERGNKIDDLMKVIEKSRYYAAFFGFKEGFKVDVTYVETYQSKIKDLIIDYSEMKQYVKKDYFSENDI